MQCHPKQIILSKYNHSKLFHLCSTTLSAPEDDKINVVNEAVSETPQPVIYAWLWVVAVTFNPNVLPFTSLTRFT